MKSTEMLELLREFHCDKATQRQGHAAAAEYVADYDYNNTYQYVIAREDMHLRWLIDAIVDLGSEPQDVPVPKLTPSGKGTEAQRSVIARDRDSAGQFIEKWRVARRLAAKRAASDPAARHPRRDAGTQALLRHGARRTHRPARPASRRCRHRRRRSPDAVARRRADLTVPERPSTRAPRAAPP